MKICILGNKLDMLSFRRVFLEGFIFNLGSGLRVGNQQYYILHTAIGVGHILV